MVLGGGAGQGQGQPGAQSEEEAEGLGGGGRRGAQGLLGCGFVTSTASLGAALLPA